MREKLDGRNNTVASFLKPVRGLRLGENVGEYLFCDRGFVPTITIVVEREIAARVRHTRACAWCRIRILPMLQLAGCTFDMSTARGAIWRDTPDPEGVSVSAARNAVSAQRFADWPTEMGGAMTRKARLRARGWPYAKRIARSGKPLLALRLFLTAMLHGCYGMRLAGVVFLQIFLDPNAYRPFADRAIPWLHPIRDP